MPPLRSIQDLDDLRQKSLLARSPEKTILAVCSAATCGMAAGAPDVFHALRKEIERRGVGESIEVKGTGCHGFCEQETTVIVWPEGIFYT
ncbi:MAG TPA: (2Fe-2S) ferredoxin domain-containing protein, partial [Candidatus Nitrosotenuis sp.]|nr:(2Fe-2S) ferredoxin domain-containing protein [Candidatus Nitrosotenuis sp.]